MEGNCLGRKSEGLKCYDKRKQALQLMGTWNKDPVEHMGRVLSAREERKRWVGGRHAG